MVQQDSCKVITRAGSKNPISNKDVEKNGPPVTNDNIKSEAKPAVIQKPLLPKVTIPKKVVTIVQQDPGRIKTRPGSTRVAAVTDTT